MSEKIFAVAGNPILHSRSPSLFNVFFQALNVDALYTRISAANAEEAVKTAKAIKLCGMNVTSPLKEPMVGLLDRVDGHASKIRAVNTVVFKHRKLVGHNTDYEGVIRALEHNGISPCGRNVIVLGAGGAARAAVYGMKISGAKKITVLNRTIGKARLLAGMLSCDYAAMKKFHELIVGSDLLISCIPESLPVLDEAVMPENLALLEADYKHHHSRSGLERKQKGLTRVSGLDWLFFQAVRAFQIFTGLKIPGGILKNVYRKFTAGEDTKKRHIALTGFMGAGKSTVGRKLAEEMAYEFVDTDLLIERLSGRTIPEIFRLDGEKKFRELETSVIQKIFRDSSPKVISFGGGAILDERNCDVIRENCLNIWLWVSIPVVLARVVAGDRPLLSSFNPGKKAEFLLAVRKPRYLRLADLVINSEQGTVLDIVRRIKHEMDRAR